MKDKYKYLILIGVVIILCVIFVCFRYNTFNSKSIKLDGNRYILNVTLSKYLKDFKIDYKESDINKNFKLQENREDDLEVNLENTKYNKGVSVIVENNTKYDLDLKDATVTELIIDTSNLKTLPEVMIGSKLIKWNITKKEAKKIYGKSDIEDYFDDIELIGYRDNKTNLNLYFKNDKLYKVMLF